MWNGHITKDIWAQTIPRAYTDNTTVSKRYRKFGAHNSRMGGLSRLSRRVNKIENQRELINPALNLIVGE